MKKKIISLLLTVVMIVSMASVLTVNAFAEPTVTIVQVAQGDTVISICKKYGFDYYSYKKLVMALNNVSDESEFSKIKVGGYFAVPDSGQRADKLQYGRGQDARHSRLDPRRGLGRLLHSAVHL